MGDHGARQRHRGAAACCDSRYPVPSVRERAKLSPLVLAMRYHAGQTDKAGQPYWRHCERVAANLVNRWPHACDDAVAAAFLHDVLEDCPRVTPTALLRAGVSEKAVEVIRIVTKGAVFRRDMPYLDWIRAIAGTCNLTAIRVKIADNMDNSDPTRSPQPPEFGRLVAEKYGPARLILEQALR